MARSWEKTIKKNQKKLNDQRAKEGKKPITGTGDSSLKFRGRSFVFPFVLLSIMLFYVLTFRSEDNPGMYWFTVISYILLAAIIFFLRRPYLTIGDRELSTRRFTGPKVVKADDVEHIDVYPGYITIKLKGARNRWVFSRMFNLFPTNEMTEALKQFATKHGISWKTGA